MAAGNNDTQRQGVSPHAVWALVLLICGLVQYIISWWVIKFGADTDVVSHVGFGGTIVSIILAVLAILYSYFQTFAQQRDSSNISTQIDRLRETVSNIRTSEEDLSTVIERFTEVSGKLDSSIEIGRRSSSEMQALTVGFEELKRETRSKAMGQPDSNAQLPSNIFDEKAIAVELVRRSGFYHFPIYLALVLGAENRLSPAQTQSQIVIPAFISHKGESNYISWTNGLLATAFAMLADLRIITRNEDKSMSVLAEFRQAVLEQAKNPPTYPDDDPILTVESIFLAAQSIKKSS